MSLRTQLWIAIAGVMLLSLLVSIGVSTVSAQQYLAQQLHVKNVDNATSLALSITQLPKDGAQVELALAAQFDAGHYRSIRLVNPRGELIQERVNRVRPQGVPAWFLRLMAFDVQPGVAHISDGWSQFGVLTVESQTSYAYEALWQGTLRLALIFTAGALLIGLAGSWLLGRTVRPLKDVVMQAEAVGQRRFITIVEPNTLEFRAVVSAMNRLSHHVKTMLTEESNRLQELKARLQHDPVTGLLTRDHFMTQLAVTLSANNAGAAGVLLLLRVQDLPILNRDLGRQELDAVLTRLGQTLRALARENDYGVAGRLNGSDFALIGGGVTEAEVFAAAVTERVQDALGGAADGTIRIDLGATPYRDEDPPGPILARVDHALARAELGPGFAAEIEPHDRPGSHRNQGEWADVIREAARDPGVQLAAFPVIDRAGALLHTEAPMRLFLDGEIRSAAYFMPWAVRLQLIRELDDAVLARAFAQLAADPVPLAINLSVDALLDTRFRQHLYRMLREHPTAAQALWLEFPARGALRHLAELRELCQGVTGTGCKVGIEHAGAEAFNLDELNDLGLYYVKLDGTIVAGICHSTEAQGLLRGLCTVAHSLGVLIIAENCTDAEDLAILPGLGVDGMTGPAVRVSAAKGQDGDDAPLNSA